MRKRLFLIGLIISLLTITVYASMPIPLITSADQYYSVVLDDEGEALVTLRLTIRNQDTSQIDSINLEIPGLQVSILGILQETSGYESQVCQSWSDGCVEYGQGNTCVQYDYNGNCLKYETPCLKYDKVCTSYRTNYNYQTVYKRINTVPIKLSNSVSLPIELISPVRENGETTLVIMYKVQDYTSKFLGVHDFAFETANIPYTTNTLRVAINVQDDLHLKGGSSNVNYQPNFNSFSGVMAQRAELSDSNSKQVQDYVSRIPSVSGLVKTTSYLDPLESFTVKGKYAKSWLALYWFNALLIIIAILAIFTFLIYGLKKLGKYAADNMPKKAKQPENKHNFMIPFLSGLFTTIAITLLWVITILIINAASQLLRSSSMQFFGILIMLLALLLTLATLIGVPIYIGNKYGPWLGGFTVLSLFGWLFIFVIIIFFFWAFLVTGIRVY